MKYLIVLIAILTGCTTPHYSRTVKRIYDADGSLIQTEVTEGIRQEDPISRPMPNALKNQTYRR